MDEARQSETSVNSLTIEVYCLQDVIPCRLVEVPDLLSVSSGLKVASCLLLVRFLLIMKMEAVPSTET